MAKPGGDRRDAAILETLGDFTSKENWDKFFTLRGSGDSFEWYADWPELCVPLLSLLSGDKPETTPTTATDAEILVPGCGSSALSERLYDAGYRRITNIDFSRVVVSDMLRRHVRDRPEMKWRVMDMTDLQFADELFDVVLDKGGLDALLEPEVGEKLGIKYLAEVKRVLKVGGKFLCITLAEPHVLGVISSEFRFGWEMSIQAIPHRPSPFQTFIMSVLKGKPAAVSLINSLFDQSATYCNKKQVDAVVNAIAIENDVRQSCSDSGEIVYSLRDLQLGALGDLKELSPGQRSRLILGDERSSLYSYKAVFLDARKQSEPFVYLCGVFIVPKIRAHDWLFTSEEGQWLVVESAKAARLIMIFLDSRHMNANMDVIKKDLSPLVKDLTPGETDDGVLIPFMMAGDGIKERNVVKQVTSEMTGPIIVEDVAYENASEDKSTMSEQKMFRRLIFQRNMGLVQSEALLVRNSSKVVSNADKRVKVQPTSRKGRGQKKGRSYNKMLDGPTSDMSIDYSFLCNSYHSSIISGFTLIEAALSSAVVSGEKVKTIIVGLGAGILPMFLHQSLPFLDIEVVELDPTVADLARECFGFKVDDHMKIHVGDGIEFIKHMVVSESSVNAQNEHPGGGKPVHLSAESDSLSNRKISASAMKIIIVDADSSDLSSGLSCPPGSFVEPSFLKLLNILLSGGGIFIINLVSRSLAVREMVISRLKAVFACVYSLQLEEDVNEVLFALATSEVVDEIQFEEAAGRLKALMKLSVEVVANVNNLKRL